MTEGPQAISLRGLFVSNVTMANKPTILSTKAAEIAEELRSNVSTLTFTPPVHTVYNPLDYAWAPHQRYLTNYCRNRKKVVFLGMNPGPFGMMQTGVPFGEIAAVRDWMGIHEKVTKPRNEHPKKPISGFGCNRSEVSGRRLWGLFSQRYSSAQKFFKDNFVINYCPLVFLEEGGRNRTPDKLSKAEKTRLFDFCDQHLLDVVTLLKPQWLVGVGAFAMDRAVLCQNHLQAETKVVQILHPSPASPAANRDWAGTVTRTLTEAGVWT